MYIGFINKHGDDKGGFECEVVPRVGEKIKNQHGFTFEVVSVEYDVRLYAAGHQCRQVLLIVE